MDIFTRFKQALRIREVLVDNNVFHLHYRITAVLLLCCAGLVASKQHFGDPIDCITRDDVPNKIMDTYCWIHSTFTLPRACNKTVGIEVAHPCVDKYTDSSEERVYHKYYQWVYFVLFFQAAFFYAPHFFWKSYESKLMRTLTSDLRDPLFLRREKKDKAKQVITYMWRTRGNHQHYYHMFTVFEACNFFNVLLQMYVVDEFLGGTFTTYGLDVINYSLMNQDERFDPMVRVFPRMTKCTFNRFGPSGDIQKYDALCILPLNIINEKIYITMWFWFVFLAFVTGAWLIYRALTYFKPSIRYEVLNRRASLVSPRLLSRVVNTSTTGDWFLICMMCKNMDAQWFRYIMIGYSSKLHANASKGDTGGKGRSKQNGCDAFNGSDPKDQLIIDGAGESDEDDDYDDDEEFSARLDSGDRDGFQSGCCVICPDSGSEEQIGRPTLDRKRTAKNKAGPVRGQPAPVSSSGDSVELQTPEVSRLT